MAKKKTKSTVKKSKSKKKPPELRFEITSGMTLPTAIDWREEKVMAKLAKYFKKKLDAGIRHINMAQILELFGHIPEPHHYKQLFEIADISERDDPNNDYESYYGITHNGTFYPMISDSVH